VVMKLLELRMFVEHPSTHEGCPEDLRIPAPQVTLADGFDSWASDPPNTPAGHSSLPDASPPGAGTRFLAARMNDARNWGPYSSTGPPEMTAPTTNAVV
jgi:hypothetical protein